MFFPKGNKKPVPIKSLSKGVSWSLIANVVSTLLGALAVLVLPKYLSVENYGYYQLYLLYTGLTTLLAFGIPESVYLELGGRKSTKLTNKNVALQYFCLFLLDLMLYGGFVVNICLSGELNNRNITILWVCASGFINCIRNYALFILQARGYIKQYSISVVLERTISLIPIMGATILGYSDILVLIGFDFLGRSVSFFYVWIQYRYIKSFELRKGSKFDLGYLISLIPSGLQLMIASYTSTIIISVVRACIERNWSIEIFAQVSLLISVATMISRLINAVAIPLFPALKTSDYNRDVLFYSKGSFAISFIYFIALAGMPLVSTLLGWWLPQYQYALSMAILLVPLSLFDGKMSLLVMTMCKSYRKEKFLLLLNIISLALMLIGIVLVMHTTHNIIQLLVAVVVVFYARCLIGELYLAKMHKLTAKRLIIWDTASLGLVLFCWSSYSEFLPCVSLALLSLFLFANVQNVKELFAFRKAK